ncbi:hypothetical protein KSF78_0009005 [Schistosoma japonicum]|nr:hypothetical protein KSF78_0009005 [Schistosoma japonicum]
MYHEEECIKDSKIIEARGQFKYFDKKSIKFRKYVTDEDEENWTICIMYHEEECIKNAIEYEIEKCYELAHPYPNDFEKLGQMLVGRQVAVFDSNKFFCEVHMQ